MKAKHKTYSLSIEDAAVSNRRPKIAISGLIEVDETIVSMPLINIQTQSFMRKVSSVHET